MTKKKRRGLAPSKERLREMHGKGYGTVAEVAKKNGVAPTTVYTWIDTGKLTAMGGPDAVLKPGANVWVSFEAARKVKVEA